MKYVMIFVAGFVSSFSMAQTTPALKADTADVSSIDNIVSAYYDVTNGPAGQRDWARYRSLFRPEAQLNARVFNRSGRLQFIGGTLEEYIAQVDEYFTINGFFETEIGRTVHHYNDIAQVFTAYDARLATNQASYHRGMKSLQLVYDDGRWWIVNVLYNNEPKLKPIPNEFLFEKYHSEQ
ncbi:MAG: hypothetical protein EA392_03365 [Cryomorphaceae bacterium]|nr:MAG: hypothetical protein EA392_03365 [Cryomorphaceae bacterium]